MGMWKPISIMFGATQMPFYGKNNYYSPQTMYFRLLGRPLLGCPLLGRPLLGRPLLGIRCWGVRCWGIILNHLQLQFLMIIDHGSTTTTTMLFHTIFLYNKM